MQKCSDVFSCWLYAHFPPVWLSLTVLVLACAAIGYFLVTELREYRHMLKEERQAKDERRRERRMRSWRLWSLIRQCEEWEVDTTELKESIAAEQQMRSEAGKIDGYRAIAVIPFGLVLVIAIIMMALVPPTNTLWIFYGAFSILTLIWFAVFTVIWIGKRKAFIAKYLSPAKQQAS
jgi:Flp pilus assembly protein TadB